MGKVRFKATTDFIHKRKRYEKGKTYTAEAEEAYYFKAVGWAINHNKELEEPFETVAPEPVTLEVQNVKSHWWSRNG